MTPINVMINGLPGNVTARIASHILKDNRFRLMPWSLTGPDIADETCRVDDFSVRLIRPGHRDAEIEKIKQSEGDFIAVDFTLPAAVNDNADFYCRHNIAFVMGTTGGDRTRLEQCVRDAAVSAVIAPNMAKQIVGFQAMMAYAAENFPGLFDGYTLDIRESHQQTKVDTSGTAKAMVRYFNRLGTEFTEDQIVKIRDPEVQKNQWKIPEPYINGHAWHTYTLTAPDKTAQFTFSHNINGRDIYAWGTVDAILFLQKKIAAGSTGEVFTMLDVLKKDK